MQVFLSLSPEVAESTRMPNLNRGLKLNQRCSTLSRTPECVARIQSTLESLEKSRLSFWKGVSVLCCCCPEVWGGQDDSEVLRQPTAATCRAGWQHPQHPPGEHASVHLLWFKRKGKHGSKQGARTLSLSAEINCLGYFYC